MSKKAFFDTNIWLPFIVSDGFHRRLIYAAAEIGDVIISQALWDEIAEKLALKFRFSWEQIVAGKAMMDEVSDWFTERVTPYPESPDTDDAVLLAQGLATGCEYFVTNDGPLLNLVAIEGMKLISPKDFAALLGVS